MRRDRLVAKTPGAGVVNESLNYFKAGEAARAVH
jgi:hypothetical protein